MNVIFNKLAGMLAAAVLAVALLAPLSAKAGELPESDDPIRFGMFDWTAQQAMVHIAGGILERAGYNVEYVVAGYVPAFQAVMDGDLIVLLELWEFASQEHLNRALESGQAEVIGDTGIDVREGLVYPAYMEEQCPGLPAWKALEACAEKFSTPETAPKGRIIDYPADWGYAINKIRVEAYFGDKFVMVPGGSEGNMVAEIKSAFLRKQPVIVVFFQPNYAWNDPVVTEAGGLKWVDLQPSYQAGCDEDPELGAFPDRVADCDWARSWVRNMVWAGMKDKWPVAYKFMKAFTIPNDDYASFVKRVDNDGEDLEDVAESWIDENEAKWRPWIDAAMAGT